MSYNYVKTDYTLVYLLNIIKLHTMFNSKDAMYMKALINQDFKFDDDLF